MSGPTEIARFESEAEARVCVSFLQANAIEAELADAMQLSVLPFLSPGKRGYRVLAPKSQAHAAAALLALINQQE